MQIIENWGWVLYGYALRNEVWLVMLQLEFFAKATLKDLRFRNDVSWRCLIFIGAIFERRFSMCRKGVGCGEKLFFRRLLCEWLSDFAE